MIINEQINTSSDVIFEPLKHLYEKRIRKQLNVVNEGKPQNKNNTNKRAITDYFTPQPGNEKNAT